MVLLSRCIFVPPKFVGEQRYPRKRMYGFYTSVMHVSVLLLFITDYTSIVTSVLRPSGVTGSNGPRTLVYWLLPCV